LDLPYDTETQCLAQVIHHEARGELRRGQESVAQVVLNRTKNKRFPKTICGVVTQPRQFSGFHRGIRPSAQAYAVAVKIRFKKIANHIGSRLYFNTTGPHRAIRIGRHLFW
jgi:spore germination cell wall hydrolase CwlJ-like protein